jgi:predicted MFS family arabinose efflux permease
MSVARDHLPPERAHSTIATISVAGTVGIGVAYPLMGLLDQLAGLRVAYGVGFLLSLCALIIAWRALPKDAPRPTPRVDILGALFLGLGILGVLLAVAQPSVWDAPWVGACILILAAIAFGAWVTWERRIPAPLVDLRLLAAGGVLRANAAMLTAGVGMYLLFSLLTRYVQTPTDAGYGFGLSGVLAGASLIPFSVLGFVAGRLTPWLTDRVSARWTFVISAACVIVAAGLFAITPGSLIATLAAMAVLGFGVGGASAIMPRLVLNGMPQQETSSNSTSRGREACEPASIPDCSHTSRRRRTDERRRSRQHHSARPRCRTRNGGLPRCGDRRCRRPVDHIRRPRPRRAA